VMVCCRLGSVPGTDAAIDYRSRNVSRRFIVTRIVLLLIKFSSRTVVYCIVQVVALEKMLATSTIRFIHR